jgi:hypothetical protein
MIMNMRRRMVMVMMMRRRRRRRLIMMLTTTMTVLVGQYHPQLTNTVRAAAFPPPQPPLPRPRTFRCVVRWRGACTGSVRTADAGGWRGSLPPTPSKASSRFSCRLVRFTAGGGGEGGDEEEDGGGSGGGEEEEEEEKKEEEEEEDYDDDDGNAGSEDGCGVLQLLSSVSEEERGNAELFTLLTRLLMAPKALVGMDCGALARGLADQVKRRKVV